jgi:GPH family glycoside/pentoside/hexuronide:cation symporter
VTTASGGEATGQAGRLDGGTKVGYALGSLATGTFGTVPGFLLVIYLTDTLGVAAAIAGLAVAVPKFWDVIFNPIVGGWSDRTNSRMGPRRPWMLAGALSLPLFFIVMFSIPEGLEPNTSALLVAIAFLLSATAYALFQVPYVSLPAEMTQDYDERTSVVAFRIVALTIGILLSGALSPVLVNMGGGGYPGHQLMGVVIAVFMLVSMLIAVFGTRRAPRTAVPSGAASLVVAWRAARRNQYFLPLWIAYVLQALANAAMLATVPYVARYIMNDPGASSLLFAALVGPAILVMPLWSVIGRRQGKTRGYVLASLCYIVGVLGLLAVRALPTFGIVLLVVMMGIGYAGMQLFPLAMLPDTVAVDEARSGQRRSGMLTGLWTAGETAAFAIGPGLVGLVLGIFGFVSSSGGEGVAQTDTALIGIVVALAILPALAMGLSLLLISRYTLSHDVLESELAAAVPGTPPAEG